MVFMGVIFTIGIVAGALIAFTPPKKVPTPTEYEELILLVDATENELMSPKALSRDSMVAGCTGNGLYEQDKYN
jgi:hypothetical protein